MLHNALHCVAFALMLVAMQHDTRIDSDSILAFLCVVSWCLIAKKLLKILIRNFKLTQRKALCHIVNWPVVSGRCCQDVENGKKPPDLPLIT